MKNLNLIGFMMILSMILFMTSCEKEDTLIVEDTTTVEVEVVITQEVNPLLGRSISSEDGLELDCFDVLYPFSFVDVDGVEYPINNFDEIISLSNDNPEVVIADFVYPITIATEDGETQTVEDAEVLGELFAQCTPAGGWSEDSFPAYLIDLTNSCYTFDYPITLGGIDGEVVANDEDEFIALVAEAPMYFVFPLNLVAGDGSTVSVLDVEMLFSTLFDCNQIQQDSLWDWEVGFEYIGCYMVEFPISVVTDNGEVTVNNHMELCDLMLEGQILGYGFPLTLIDQNGEELTVTNEEEFNEALDECWGIPTTLNGDLFFLVTGAIGEDGTGENGCYEIDFPISATAVDAAGNTEVSSINSIIEIMQTGIYLETFSVDYPVTVTVQSGEVETLESTEDLLEILENCM